MSTLIPVLIPVLLGYLCHKARWIKETTKAGAWDLVTTIFFPVLIFSVMAKASIKPADFTLALYVLAITTLISFLAKPLTRNIPDPAARYLCTTEEGGTIALPLYLTLFPKGAWTLVFDVGIVAFNFIVLPVLESGEHKHIFKNLITNPFVIAMALGLVFNLTGLYAAFETTPYFKTYDSAISMLTGPVTPVLLFCLGYDFSFNPKLVKLMGLRAVFAVLSVAGFFLFFHSLTKEPSFLCAILIYFASPPSFGMLPVLDRLYTETTQEKFTDSFTSSWLAITFVMYGICLMLFK